MFTAEIRNDAANNVSTNSLRSSWQTESLQAIKEYNMSKVFLLVIIQILIFSFLFSQTIPDSLWFNTYGGNLSEKAYSLIQTSDNNFVFTGNSQSFGNGYDNVYLVKTDENGNELWGKTFSRSNWDFGYSVYETFDGGFIITGQTLSDNSGNYDIYLIKTDANGDTLWTKAIDNSFYEYGRSVIQTNDGGFLITGWGQTPNSGIKLILFKTDGNGNVLWNNYIGGEFSSCGNSIQQTSDGGFIITGYITSNEAPADLYLVKTNVNGDTLWTKRFSENGNCYGNDVKQTNDDGFIIAGYVEYNVDDSDIYLIRTNEYGDTLWTKTIGDLPDCGAESIQQTNDDGFIISGWKHEIGSGHYDIYVLKTDNFGDTLWSKSFGGDYNDVAFDLVVDNEGEFIITGYTDSYPSPGNCSAFLLKLGYETGTDNIINSSHYSMVNYPNPFNPDLIGTTIYFTTETTKDTEIIIYNIKGQKIKTFQIAQSEIHNPNYVVWDGNDNLGRKLSNGIYLYQLKIGSNIIDTKKCLLMK